MTKIQLLPISILLLATACAPKNLESIQQLSSETTGAVGCENFESRSWSAVDRYLIEHKEIPSVEDLKESLKISLKDLKGSPESLSDEQVAELATKIGELYDVMLVEAPQKEKVQSADQLLEVLSALELGDHTTDTKVQLQNRVKAQFAAVQNQIQTMGVACQVPDDNTTTGVNPVVQTPQLESTTLALPVFGVRFAMATAYQTCQALDEPVMNASTPDLAGITVTGKHSDGVGNKRAISSLSTVLKTHPYYKNVNNYAANCLNPKTSPMIYDYGGKPYATTSSSSTLSFFKNAGSGTSVLGIDCSGFIYTALSTAGLRVAPNKDNKAAGVYGISATMYVEPQKNGLSCLDKITVTPKESIKAGDVVAVSGHVLMIDSVGNDPFGLNDIKTTADCAKVTYKKFDFVVAQSSPSKNAVGINRFEAKTYLGESDKMRSSLESYAKYACQSKFSSKNVTPNLGTSSVIRHKLTAACLGTRVALAQEACIQSCPQLKK